MSSAMAPGAWAPAVFEHEVVCLFVDWRNRDAMTRVLLPQDAVFLSRGFSETVAAAVQVAGGIECDAGASSIVAVFDSRAQAGFAMACRTALGAARRLDQALTALADRWNNEFGVTADFALCAHVGSAALGEIGSPTSSRLTLAGPVVESARRLRFAASAQGTRIAVSADVLRAAGASAVEIAALSVETTDGMKWSPAATLAALPNHLFAA